MSLTLTNYWWLLIWLFVGGAIFSGMPKRQEHFGSKSVERWDYMPAILMALPYIIWAGFRDNVADTYLYRLGFERATTNLLEIPSQFTGEVKDPGYEVLVIIIKAIIGNHSDLFFLLIAVFQVLCMVYIFRKYSSYYWTCLFLFVASTDFMSWMMNGMRQFIAVTAILACFGLMLRKKYLPVIGIILLVSTLHQSALLMIPIVFIVQGRAWNKKTIIMLAVTLIVIVFIDKFTPFLESFLQNTQYDTAFSNENDDGVNVIRVLVYSVPALLSLMGLKYIRAANDSVINMSVNCSIVTMALYLVAMVTSGIYIGRLPIYTTLQGYIAVPWLIDNIFEKRSSQLVKYAMIILFCLFFYYQMFIAWNYS